MDKDKLRPCEWQEGVNVKTGWHVGWDSSEQGLYAIVEIADGTVTLVRSLKFRFTDREGHEFREEVAKECERAITALESTPPTLTQEELRRHRRILSIDPSPLQEISLRIQDALEAAEQRVTELETVLNAMLMLTPLTEEENAIYAQAQELLSEEEPNP